MHWSEQKQFYYCSQQTSSSPREEEKNSKTKNTSDYTCCTSLALATTPRVVGYTLKQLQLQSFSEEATNSSQFCRSKMDSEAAQLWNKIPNINREEEEEQRDHHHLLFQGPFASFPKIYFCLLLFFPDRDVGDGSFITIHQHIDYVSQKTRENKRTNMVCFYTRENRSCCMQRGWQNDISVLLFLSMLHLIYAKLCKEQLKKMKLEQARLWAQNSATQKFSGAETG